MLRTGSKNEKGKKNNNKHSLFYLASHLFSSSLKTPSLSCCRSGFIGIPQSVKGPL